MCVWAWVCVKCGNKSLLMYLTKLQLQFKKTLKHSYEKDCKSHSYYYMTHVLYTFFFFFKKAFLVPPQQFQIYIYSSRAVAFLMSGVTFSLSMCNIGKNGTHFSHLPIRPQLLVSEKTFFARKPTDKHATVCLKPTWRTGNLRHYVAQWKSHAIYNTCACREGSSRCIYSLR